MTDQSAEIVFKPKPDQPPPPATVGVLGWLHQNLFSSIFSSILTLLGLYALYLVGASIWEWGFTNAIWEAENRRACLDHNVATETEGACWAGVKLWFKSFMYGRYPIDERWRVNLGFILLVLWLAPLWFSRVTGRFSFGITAVLVYPFLAAYLFAGGERGLFMQFMVLLAMVVFVMNWLHILLCYTTNRSLTEHLIQLTGFAQKHDSTHKYPVLGFALILMAIAYALFGGWEAVRIGTNQWGGLFLTLVIAGVAIVFALPGGIILALARRSTMPIIKVLSIAFIELFRSVPLITVLFMAVTMFPLFLPEGFELNKLLQAMVGVCLFAAAYMAEVIRGGLQAIPRGQYEAAQAMGLTYWKMMNLIILPQALKLMIPNIVGNFIGLLKDTTLVSIIGLYDMLRMLNTAGQNPQWIGLHKETLFFGAVVYFILCFAMSQYSQHLERKLATGH